MSKPSIVLTGITTTGTPHLGNYVGAIRPAIAASKRPLVRPFFFLADLHALIKCQEPERVQRSTLEIAAVWLALGLDTEHAVFYRQSDVPEIPELSWMLQCVTAKGLMNRAHAYKAAVQANTEAGVEDEDAGVSMGLFGYPVLMAADILMFNADKVPVGKDQVQHLEMARDIAGRFNHLYGEHFVLPQAVVDEEVAVLTGLDGRKMSKSYDNVIPVFQPTNALRKLIMRIKTNSLEPGAPKDPETCTLFAIYRAFANAEQVAALRDRYAAGIGWGDMKQLLYETIDAELKDARTRYDALMQEPARIEEVLQAGAKKARAISAPFLQRLRHAVGLRPLQKG
jgi:tryptophanyl-tRNA synthetase